MLWLPNYSIALVSWSHSIFKNQILGPNHIYNLLTSNALNQRHLSVTFSFFFYKLQCINTLIYRHSSKLKTYFTDDVNLSWMFLQMWSRCEEICSMPQRQTDSDRDLAKLNPWGQKPGKMRYMFVNQVKRNDCRMSWVYKSLQFVFRLRQLPTGPPCCIVRVFQDSLEPGFRSLTMNSNLFSLTHPFLHMDMLKCIIFLP